MKLKRIILLLLTVMFSFSYGEVFAKDGNSLKKALKNKFLIGVSVNTHQSSGKDVAAVEIVKKNFNSIVAENCMKSSVIHPKENKYNFAQADEFVSFGESNQMAIIGHCLIWHSQLAPWFCVDKDGNNVSPEVLKKRMKDHITTIVKRYKGRIKGWDVVNEAIEDNGAYRKTKFYEILGEEYIPLAFQYAHEADPDAELYYNDYSMAQPGRREAVVKMVNDLKKRGIRIDAIGMQGHIGMDYPKISEFEKSMLAFAGTGVKIMITELDLTVIPSPNPNVGAEFWSEYGMTLIYTVLTAVLGFIGIAIKQILSKLSADKTKESVVKTCVNAAEQLYKDLHGEEKLAKVKENIVEMLNEKGISISDIEMDMLIEAAVAEINKQLKKKEGAENGKD